MVTVVCTGGEDPPAPLSLAWLAASQRIIAADGGLAFLKRIGKIADLWVGDGDSIAGLIPEWKSWYREARLLDRAKDETDTEIAIRTATSEGSDEVWLLGGGGGRMDHWLANLRLVGQCQNLTRWLTGHEQIQILRPGESLSLTQGVVSVFPIGEGPWKASSSGLRWPIDQIDFEVWHSLSNEARSDGARVTATSGRFLLLRPWVTGVIE